MPTLSEKVIVDDPEVSYCESTMEEEPKKAGGLFTASAEHTIKRQLESRHIQLIAIGGAIGTAIFISIGSGLQKGGPLSLLLAYLFWSFIVLLLTTAVGEMVSYMPVASPFLSMSGRVVDPAMEFAAAWNFYLMVSLYIPFEIVAVNGMIHFWRDDYSPAITLSIQIVLYILLNIWAIRVFGEAEFWLALGKLILLIGLLFYTFITMVGGNPLRDPYGFRNWNVEGGPMAEYLSTGSLGKFQGLLASLIQAAFTIIGPEHMSMVAGEVKDPRKNLPIAFKSVLWRLVFFYIGGALSVGIVVAYNNPTFLEYYGASAGATSSPYVISMINLKIKVLPSIVNVLIISSAFSAGNSFIFSSSRVLHSMATRGFAPRFLSYCNANGTPIFCIGMTVVFSLLSLLQLGNSSSIALGYITSICTGSQVLNYVYMGITYIGFFRACKVQNIDRNQFTYKSWYQPYSVYFSLTFLIIMVGIIGYTSFLPGRWSTSDFIFNYIMVFINIFLVLGYKFIRRTKRVKPEEADMRTGLEEIEKHEYELYSQVGGSGEFDNAPLHAKILRWIF